MPLSTWTKTNRPRLARYSFSLFLPTIIKSLGTFDVKTSQLMTVPPYIAACICCITAGWLADRQGRRGIYMIFFNCVAILGFILQICSNNTSVKYAGTFFAAMGIYPNVPQGVAWNGNNIGGSTKRGVGIGRGTPLLTRPPFPSSSSPPASLT